MMEEAYQSIFAKDSSQRNSLLYNELFSGSVQSSLYSRVSHIRNHFSEFNLLFWNKSLLFYPLFSQKLSVSVSHKVVSYMQDSTVAGFHCI